MGAIPGHHPWAYPTIPPPSAHHVQRGHAQHPLLVVHAQLLERLHRNRHRRVDGVGDDVEQRLRGCRGWLGALASVVRRWLAGWTQGGGWGSAWLLAAPARRAPAPAQPRQRSQGPHRCRRPPRGSACRRRPPGSSQCLRRESINNVHTFRAGTARQQQQQRWQRQRQPCLPARLPEAAAEHPSAHASAQRSARTGVDLEQIVAGHARLARHARRDDDDVRALERLPKLVLAWAAQGRGGGVGRAARQRPTAGGHTSAAAGAPAPPPGCVAAAAVQAAPALRARDTSTHAHTHTRTLSTQQAGITMQVVPVSQGCWPAKPGSAPA